MASSLRKPVVIGVIAGALTAVAVFGGTGAFLAAAQDTPGTTAQSPDTTAQAPDTTQSPGHHSGPGHDGARPDGTRPRRSSGPDRRLAPVHG